MQPEICNILADLPLALPAESFETIVESATVKIERIVSFGQVTPENEWFNQDRDEWVMLLVGGAELLFEGEREAHKLKAGDYVLIPSGCRHRVTWSDPSVKTVWLAVHFTSGE